MAQGKIGRALVTGGTILGLLLLVVFIVFVVQSMIDNDKDTPYGKQKIENTPVSEDESKNQGDSKGTGGNEQKKSQTSSSEPELDPATVSSIIIEPMAIEVSYVKGINGFEYLIKRTPRGGQYVEFKNDELKGTRCTDDQGVFASIIEKPEATEAATLSKKKTIDGVEYGLSLASTNCTSDETLLKKYQESFSQAFSLLKKAS